MVLVWVGIWQQTTYLRQSDEFLDTIYMGIQVLLFQLNLLPPYLLLQQGEKHLFVNNGVMLFQLCKLHYFSKAKQKYVYVDFDVDCHLTVVYFNQQMHACACVRMVKNNEKHSKIIITVSFSLCAREAHVGLIKKKEEKSLLVSDWE